MFWYFVGFLAVIAVLGFIQACKVEKDEDLEFGPEWYNTH